MPVASTAPGPSGFIIEIGLLLVLVLIIVLSQWVPSSITLLEKVSFTASDPRAPNFN